MQDSKKQILERKKLSNAELGEIAGIAIDTNIYRSAGFRFNAPPLANLADVGSLGLQVLIPEIWEKETLSHFCQLTTSRLADVERISRITDFGTPDQVAATEVFTRLWNQESAESLASRLLEQHLTAIKARKLETAWKRGPKVLDDYFASRPPFEVSGTKKAEFPDAFALASLEEWAKELGRKVLVVSNDQGCLAACEASEQLIGFSSLIDGLAAVANADEIRRKDAATYAFALKTRLASEAELLWKSIAPALVKALEAMEVEVNSTADIQDYASDVDDVTFSRVVHWPTEKDISVLSIGQNTLSFVWRLDVDLDVSARFYRTFGRKGPGGRLHWEAPTINMSTTVDVEVVVTLQTTEMMNPEALECAMVRSVDLMDRSFSVDFGHIEPWEQDYEE